MEHKLRHLYALQLVDSLLDELEELKGDLPQKVRDLEEQHAALVERINGHEQAMRTAFMARDAADSDIIGLKEKLARYKGQQLAVRTNKEYDALTREMDHAETTIVRLEKEMVEHEAAATRARTDLEELRTHLAAAEEDLAARRTELAAVAQETEDEELRYTHERKKLLVRIAKEDLAAYQRIRKAKKGKAVVPVKRGACGGCFKQVPPQKLLELRQNKKLFTCEHCGRIIVSDEIVEAASAPA